MTARMAIAHEWLPVRAGSEKVFEAMAQTYPDADLYALSREPGVEFDFGGRPVATTLLDRSAFLRDRRDLTLPLMPLAWRLIRVRGEYDTVLTSSHACVKAFPPAREATHYCYCHAPMRYAWDPHIDARTLGLGGLLKPGLALLRRWDLRAAAHVDHFAANSEAVRDRIARFYGRDAVVIHPPVDTDWYTPSSGVERSGALAVSRFIPYKQVELAIRSCARAEVPLTVAGSGPGEADLRRVAAEAGGEVRFEIKPSDERLRELYRTSAALVFPANEDFGIVPLEAQACGTPVVALDAGGTRDTVVDAETGYRVKHAEVDEFASAVQALVSNGNRSEACRRNAERFSVERFKSRLRAWIREPVADLHSGGAS
jgi:glycosyltransferase involved in cell wall biosynthesis